MLSEWMKWVKVVVRIWGGGQGWRWEMGLSREWGWVGLFLDQCSLYDCFFLDCKTVRIFAYSSKREQSNKRSGTRLKTESETGERSYKRVRLARFARVRLVRRALPISLLILRKKPTVLQSIFFCAQRFNFVTEDYPSYHAYRKRLIINPGQYNFVRGFKRAYKPGKVTYSCACTKKVLQTQAALVLSKILFEFTRFLKLQNVIKIDAMSIQTRRGLMPGCICLFTTGPLPTLSPPGFQR